MAYNHPHDIAWNEVKKELFGTVCEVTRKVPWGFKNDKPSIHNISVDDFMQDDNYYGTIILHILAGEGEPIDQVLKTITKAYNTCVKLIILEHNPEHNDWITNNLVTSENLTAIKKHILELEPNCVINNFGRNLTISTTTLSPLWLPLNDHYYETEIKKHYVTSIDKGCNTQHFIYTLTSEDKIKEAEFQKLPRDKDYYWVIGGGWSFEVIENLPDTNHILFDTVLRQVLFCRWLLEKNKNENFNNKMNLLFPVKFFERVYSKIPEYQEQNGNPKHWRNVINKIDLGKLSISIKEIRHLSLNNMVNKGDVIYVSTVDRSLWQHLINDNIIISSYDHPRDIPKVLL